MLNRGKYRSLKTSGWQVAIAVLFLLIFGASSAFGFVLRVVDGKTGADVTTAFRYLVQVDNTFDTTPGDAVTDQLSFSIHNSNAPLAVLADGTPAQGHVTGNNVSVNVTHDGTARYYVSVLPNSGYAVGGAQVPKDATGTSEVVVFVEPTALPTAQISVFVFKDHWPINNAPDDLVTEPGIGGVTLIVSDAGGPLWQDAFGNPIGTVYDRDNPACLDASTFDPDPAGPCVVQMGSGVITTLTNADYCADLGFAPGSGTTCDELTPVTPPSPSVNPYGLMPGEAVVKFIPPGKYGIVVVPPDDGNEYILTSTIEGTPTVDAWVQADEAQFFIEQFGAASPWHAFYGYVIPSELSWAVSPPTGPGSIVGENRFMHFSRPPNNQSLDVGPPVDNCWVGVNDAITGEGLYATACNPDSTFSIDVPGVPEGTYELVTWDKPLDALFSFHPVKVPETIDAQGNPIAANYDLNKTLLSSRWFGTLKGNIFIDDGAGNPALANNGFRDPGEGGLIDQAVLLRFRDGTIYQATVSDPAGDYELTEIFPFFKWLVVEVDFARYKATGMTAAVDLGGTIPPANGWAMPSFDILNPQPQLDPATMTWNNTTGAISGTPLVNPNTGNNLSRTETGVVLTLAMQDYLTQANVIDWGKNFYGPGADGIYGPGAGGVTDDENGGISGIVYYAVTRAEDDPKWAAAEEWEPGIPNVQVVLYHDDAAPFGKIDCLDNTTGAPVADQVGCVPELADVDNYPFQWNPMFAAEPGFTGAPGPEDIDRLDVGVFNFGDAVQLTYTDSWDADKPTGCYQDVPVIHGNAVSPCADSYGTWNQIRPGVFDGGYAFDEHYELSMHVDFNNPAATILPLQSGTFVVEAATPHGYIQIREQDKNVDFGDEFVPSPNVLPAVCVGDVHTVPPYLSLWTDETGALLPDIAFSGIDIPAPLAGQDVPYCDRKQVSLTSGLNAAAEFFFFTKVPIAARGLGFINNDLAPEFNMASPAFGEKMAPSWLPVSLRDWAGRQVAYTHSDEFGSYEFLVPGSYTVNQASPTGVTLAMYNIIINDPMMQDPANPVTNRIPDPWHSPDYAVVPWTFQFETGRSSYIDSPIVPTAAFVGYPQGTLDVNPADGVPVISEVTQGTGDPGALACNIGDAIILSSPGTVEVPNPDYDPAVGGSTPTILRDYGFGATQGAGSVTLNGVALTVTSWSNTSITATVEAGVGTGGDLFVTRDNGNTNLQAVTVVVGSCGPTYRFVDGATGLDDPASGAATSPYATIQYAVDQAVAGDTIFVAAGSYNEQVIVDREVALQGAGDGTIINSRPAVQSDIQVWRDKLIAKGGVPDAATEVPGFMAASFGAAFDPAEPNIVIDGFQVTGGTTGGGIYVLDGTANAIVRNNLVTGNQGVNSGGITVGLPAGAAPLGNPGVQVINNTVTKNSGVAGGGGITIFSGATNYVVAGNVVQGNLSRQFGGGISHQGFSSGGLIDSNLVAFNETFYFAAVGGDGGGIYVGREPTGNSSGSVVINSNLVQGNLSGSSFGGGIRVSGLNSDVDTTSTVGIYNNMVVNNVAAMFGGGISLQDAANVEIINNTVANNDSTSTAQLAFPNTNLNPSAPGPAGIQAGAHSAALAGVLGTNVPAPVLENNIVHNNRSYFHQGLNVGGGALAFNGYWDLGITGLATPGSSALNPDNSVLTSLVGQFGEDYNDGTNLAADPAFVLSYTNTLTSAATLDEGGNNISVRFDELTLSSGDYHIQATSPAAEMGQAVVAAELAVDFDGDARPSDVAVDIGADEVPGATPTFALLSPNGGETLARGMTYTIQWAQHPSADNYRLHYFDADGTSHAAGFPGNTNSFAWTVPLNATVEPGKLFRVSAFNGLTWLAADYSDATFAVTAQMYPNGGETLVEGQTYTLNWAAIPGADSYRLHYFDADSTAHLIEVTGAVNSTSWTVPFAALAEAGKTFRVVAFSGGTSIPGSVQWSDNPFTIATQLSPNGGEVFTQGQTYPLTWAPVAGADSYRLHYFDADGTAHLITGVGATTSYNWTVPVSVSVETGKTFRVTPFSGGANIKSGIQLSDGTFEVN